LRLLVVCGAEKTETGYFRGLRDHLGAVSVDVKIKERAIAPDQVVEFARDHCGRDDFDETWCVVDVDRFERDGGRVTAAARLAGRAGIRLAVSNPCFEYWLLLHHAESAAPEVSCGPVVDRLRQHLPAYDKGALSFADFAGGVPAAIERARRREPTGNDHFVSPSTGVWVLATRMLERAT
jgi:hypothetical protein